jgi:hypothetical protein
MEQNVIFVYPLNALLNQLKAELEKDSTITVFEVDLVEEYQQLVASLGKSVTVSSDLKKTTRYLDLCKTIVSKKNHLNIFVSKDLPSGLTMVKLEKNGLNEAFPEYTKLKLIQNKIDSFFRIIETYESTDSTKVIDKANKSDLNTAQKLERLSSENQISTKKDEKNSLESLKEKNKAASAMDEMLSQIKSVNPYLVESPAEKKMREAYEGIIPDDKKDWDPYKGEDPTAKQNQPAYEGKIPDEKKDWDPYKGEDPTAKKNQPAYEGKIPDEKKDWDPYKGEDPTAKKNQQAYEGKIPDDKNDWDPYKGKAKSDNNQSGYEGKIPDDKKDWDPYKGESPVAKKKQEAYEGKILDDKKYWDPYKGNPTKEKSNSASDLYEVKSKKRPVYEAENLLVKSKQGSSVDGSETSKTLSQTSALEVAADPIPVKAILPPDQFSELPEVHFYSPAKILDPLAFFMEILLGSWEPEFKKKYLKMTLSKVYKAQIFITDHDGLWEQEAPELLQSTKSSKILKVGSLLPWSGGSGLPDGSHSVCRSNSLRLVAWWGSRHSNRLDGKQSPL